MERIKRCKYLKHNPIFNFNNKIKYLMNYVLKINKRKVISNQMTHLSNNKKKKSFKVIRNIHELKKANLII